MLYKEVFTMLGKSPLGGLFGDNCAILFFIILFLLLFACPGGIGGLGYRED
jgi:hypothetical protein